MNNSEEIEIKKEFQLERVIFFSDAVFAIIITIMVLDIKVPEILQNAGMKEVKDAFIQILVKLLAYAFSFFLIGNFWIRHLSMFSFLKDYNKPLVGLNLLFLFALSLFPFALSFLFGSHIIRNTWGLYTYFSVLFFGVLTQTILIGYLIKNKDKLCVKTDKIEEVLKWKVARLNYIFIPVLIVFIILTGYFNLGITMISWSITFYGIAMMRLKRKYYPKNNDNRPMIASFFSRNKKANKLVE